MGRRSTLVAFAALAAAAFVPANAFAASAPTGLTATPNGTAAPVHLSWTVAGLPDNVSQGVWRAPGACPGGLPVAGAQQIATPAVPLLGPGVVTYDDPALADGTWCYYVEAVDAALGTAASNLVQVVIDTAPPPDTTPPTANPPIVGFTGAPNYVRGAVTVTLSSSDAGSPPTTNSLRLGTTTCGIATPAIPAAWNTTAVGDGTYLLCNVATDAVGNSAASTPVAVVVDNTPSFGGIATPGAGAFVTGSAANQVALTANLADATAGIRNVQWQRSANGNAWNPIGGLVTTAGNGYLRNWNPAAQAVGDGPDYLRAIVTDNAGNQFITATIGITVDNTAPDVAAVITAPPAVAGSPTISWTPAHDAIGLVRYDVLRNGSVIGTVAATNGTQNFSFNDKNAPDQATSNYVVRAYDNANHTADSASVGVLVDSAAQSAPRALAAATPTAAAPALNWQAPAVFNVDHYDIYRDGLPLASTVGPGTSYTDANAEEGEHDYAVLARSAAAQPGVLSSSFTVLLDQTPPTSGGAPTAQVMASGSVQLVWPAAGDVLSGVSGYVVRRASGGVPPAAADGGIGVCEPTEADCSDVATESGTWSYGVFARDVAGNVALIGTVAGVVINDNTAPLAPTKLSLVRPKAKKPRINIAFTLRWAKPTAPDLDRVVVVLNLKRAPRTPADGKAIYKGLDTSAKFTLRAGQTGYLALFAYDHSGNISLKPARTLVTLAALIPLRPLTGSTVRAASPVLSWKAKKGTAYYNVQLFVNGKRILVGWPAKAGFRIKPGKLERGSTYVWYVWPAIKHKGKPPTFGPLIGRATFIYK
jgi:hypothetical protein